MAVNLNQIPYKPERACNPRKAVKLRLQGYTYDDIAVKLGCGKSTVSECLNRYFPEGRGLSVYRNHKADYLQSKQAQLLHALDESKISAMSGRDLVVATGVLYDKERLERGLSSANISVQDISSDLNELEAEEAALMDELKMLDAPDDEG
jgi:transposase